FLNWTPLGPVISGTGNQIDVITTMPSPAVVLFFRQHCVGDAQLAGDLFTTWEKHQLGLSEQVLDTRGDGIPDWWKWQYGLDLFSDVAGLDPDGDGLTNLQEFQSGTKPTLADTDGDGFSDGDEAANGTDPNNAADFGRLERCAWTGLLGTRVSDLTKNE